MPDTVIASGSAVVAAVVISVLIFLLWLALVPGLGTLNASDAAGNAIAQAFTAFIAIGLWVLLAILLILAILCGAVPIPARIAALILGPASFLAVWAALQLLAKPDLPPFLWPIAIPAAVPPLIIAFCFWALLPWLRSAIPAGIAVGTVWGAILLLCLAILPMLEKRNSIEAKEAARRAEWAAGLDKVPAEAPLWELTPFLAISDYVTKEKALLRIRHLDRRQADAETMLDRGDFPLLDLGSVDLEPTPALCDKARVLLRRRAAALAQKESSSSSDAEIAAEVEAAANAMEWLVGYDCPCDAESQAWEAVAKAHPDPANNAYRLTKLREPEALGRTLRFYPARFSMLTPRAHLSAWLQYADEKSLREQALDGARRLEHRNEEAVEMLQGSEFAAGTLLRYLPELDLQATEPLCVAARKALRERLAKIYRPKSDDPRPYSELLERLAYGGEHLRALLWLGEHGCDGIEAELGEAEALVATYQDSPARAAMLAALAQARRKP